MPTARQIAKTLGGREMLAGKVVSLAGLRERLRQGLPYSSFEAVTSGYGIERDEAAAVLRLPERTLARRKKEKVFRPDESDRLFRLGRIAAYAEEVLGSREKGARWLRRPNRGLGGQTPLSLLDTDPGTRQVEDALGRIEHGVFG